MLLLRWPSSRLGLARGVWGPVSLLAPPPGPRIGSYLLPYTTVVMYRSSTTSLTSSDAA